jgi:ATP-dependent Clp protease ATP-binding subunit ClpA
VFERFTERARLAVVEAQEEAIRFRHRYIGTEHLLLGVTGQETSVGARALRRLGFELEPARGAVRKLVGEGPPMDPSVPDDDAAALEAIGIDLEEVRRRAEAAFGPGALDRGLGRRRRRRGRCVVGPLGGSIPFTPRAKKCLELGLREAVRLGHNYIGTEHILLGILREGQGLAVDLLRDQGVSPDGLRAAVMGELAQAS